MNALFPHTGARRRHPILVSELRNKWVIWLESFWKGCVRQCQKVGQDKCWTHLAVLPKTSSLLDGTSLKPQQPIVMLIIIITLKIFKADVSLGCP